MILYIENPKITKDLLKLINEFSEVARYKINIQKPIVFLYANNEQLGSESFKKIPFKIASAAGSLVELMAGSGRAHAKEYFPELLLPVSLSLR